MPKLIKIIDKKLSEVWYGRNEVFSRKLSDSY
jgi:hypothetical protein